MSGPSYKHKGVEIRRVSAPYIHKALYAKKSTALYLYRNLLFSPHHLATHYQPQNNRAQEAALVNNTSRKHRDVEQDLKLK